MRTVIIGAGGLGSVFGGYLHEAGNDVCLVDIWKEHVERIREDGLRLDRPNGEQLTLDVPATTAPENGSPVDVMFIFVKAMHTESAIRDAKTLVGDDTCVVTLQNGLTNMDILRDHLEHDQVYGGYALVGATLHGLGHVEHTSTGNEPGKIGGSDPDQSKKIATMLDDAGIPMAPTEDPIPHIWEKQMYSVAFKPMAALTGLRVGELGAHQDTMDLMEDIVREVAAVADAKGIDLPTDDPINKLHRRVEEVADAKSSMLQDVENQRKTEIDQINGAIIEYGEEVDVDTPVNRMLTALVRGKERSYLTE